MRSIGWLKKVAAYRAYRRLRKIKPAAERCGLSRPTVRLALKDLEGQGFALEPRLGSLSEEDLRELQLAHIEDVREQVLLLSLPTPTDPWICMYGREQSTSLFEPESDAFEALVPAPDVRWHLRDQHAVRTLTDLVSELGAYDFARGHLLDRVTSQVIEAVGLPVRQDPDVTPGAIMRREGWIWSSTIDCVHRAVFEKRELDVDQWGVRPEGSEEVSDWASLRQGDDMELLVGPRRSVEESKVALAGLLQGGLEPLCPEAMAIELLHRELLTLVGLGKRKLSQAANDQPFPGVCPACPYPELDEPGP